MRNPLLDQLLRATPEYAQAMEQAAQQLVPAVKAAAPDVTGHYKDSITSAGNRVISTDPFAHIIEFGSVNNPPYAPLRTGVTAAGHRLAESRI